MQKLNIHSGYRPSVPVPLSLYLSFSSSSPRHASSVFSCMYRPPTISHSFLLSTLPKVMFWLEASLVDALSMCLTSVSYRVYRRKMSNDDMYKRVLPHVPDNDRDSLRIADTGSEIRENGRRRSRSCVVRD